MIVKRNRTGVVALVVLVMGIAATAWAFGPRRGGPGFGGEPGGVHGGGLLERLLDPCRGDCLDTARTCGETAESTALSCAQSTCASQIQAAQSACASDRGSQACRTAVSDLKECLSPCLDDLHMALSTCRDALGSCREACNSSATPTPS